MELSLRKNVVADQASGGKAGLGYLPNTVQGEPTIPSTSVWMTAKESELTVLLQQPEAAMYVRLELQHKILQDTIDRWLLFRTQVRAFEENFADAEPGSVPDLSLMSGDELRAYSMLLTRDFANRDDVANRLK